MEATRQWGPLFGTQPKVLKREGRAAKSCKGDGAGRADYPRQLDGSMPPRAGFVEAVIVPEKPATRLELDTACHLNYDVPTPRSVCLRRRD